MNIFSKLIGIALCLAALPAMAKRNPDGTYQWEVVSDGVDGVLIAKQIEEIVGAPGEDKVAVLHRAAERLVAYSKDTGFEGCAEICTSGTGADRRFGLTITSVKSHLGCPVLPVCPEGFATSGEGDIHSHGSSRPYRVNKADSALSHYEVGEVQKDPHNHFQFSAGGPAGQDGCVGWRVRMACCTPRARARVWSSYRAPGQVVAANP